MKDCRSQLTAPLPIMLFFLNTVLNAISPILIIPSVISQDGQGAWAGVAVGQSVGTVVSVLVVWGWAVNGPIEAARCESSEKLAKIAGDSIVPRLMLAIPGTAAAATVAGAIAPAFAGASSLVAAATALSGIGLSWLFVGTRDGIGLLAGDSLPKLLAGVLGSLAILLGAPVEFYPFVLIIAICLGVKVSLKRLGLSLGSVLRGSDRYLSSFRLIFARASLASSQLTSAVYINGSVTLVAIGTSSAAVVSEYAAINRLYLMGCLGTLPIFQLFLGWVASDSGTSRRGTDAIRWQLLLALLSIAAFIAAAPFLGRLLFVSSVRISTLPTVLMGFCLGIVIMSRAVGSQLLLVRGLVKPLAISSATGALVAVVAIPYLTLKFGTPGSASGLLIVELLVLLIQVVSACTQRGSRSNDG